ncbi:MAG: hypothetical protein ABL974_04320 [Prosthecobacter sp.]
MTDKSKISRRWTVLATAGAMCLFGQLSIRAEWQAGAASIDITPSQPVRLSGNSSRTHESESSAMPLQAKALALTWNQDAPVVMLTVDSGGVPAVMRAEVLDRVATAGWKLDAARFSLHSSHTHSAPMLPGAQPFQSDAKLTSEEKTHAETYAKELTARMAEVVINALNAQRPVKVDWSIGKVGFALNSRLKTGAQFTNGFNFGGTQDHSLPVLRVTDLAGKLRVIYSSYACHCTTVALDEIHSDWAGYAQKELELRFPDCVAMTAIGCGADQSPYPRSELKFAKGHGIELAKEAVRLINLPMKPVTGPVTCAAKEVMLPFDAMPKAPSWHKRTLDKNKWTAQHASFFVGQAKKKKIPSALPYTVQVWAFADSLLTINLPGEVVVDYSLRFKKQYDPTRTWVNAYTNDVPCFIPSQRIWEEGGYEADPSTNFFQQPNRFAAGIEDIIASAVAELVPAGYKKKR